MKTTHLYQKEVTLQADRRQISAELIKIISDLWYEKSIEIVLFRNQLIDKNVSEILNLHEYAALLLENQYPFFILLILPVLYQKFNYHHPNWILEN